MGDWEAAGSPCPFLKWAGAGWLPFFSGSCAPVLARGVGCVLSMAARLEQGWAEVGWVSRSALDLGSSERLLKVDPKKLTENDGVGELEKALPTNRPPATTGLLQLCVPGTEEQWTVSSRRAGTVSFFILEFPASEQGPAHSRRLVNKRSQN